MNIPTAKGATYATYTGADIIVESGSEIDGRGVLVDGSITATEVAEMPMEFSER